MSKVNWAKIKNWLLVVLVIATLGMGGLAYATFMNLQDEQNKLTAHDAKIQRLNTKLGIAESSLLSERDLNKKYKGEVDEFPEKLKDIISEYDLRIHSRDKTIVALRSEIKGGKTTVEVGGERDPNVTPTLPEGLETEECGKWLAKQVIKYKWEEDLGRFILEDPDIFVEGDETFVTEQHLIVMGHVLYGKDGNLQIRRVEIKEVVPSGTDSEGNIIYTPIDGSNVKLVDSQFEYTNTLPVKEKSFFDIFTLRPIATFDSALMPGLGVEVVNFGRILRWGNIGIAPKLAFDASDPLGGSLQNSRLGVGVHYHLLPPLVNTNFALGVGLSTPFNHFGSLDHLAFTVDLTLFLTDDLTFWKND